MRIIITIIFIIGLNNLYSQTQVGSSFTTINENEWIGWDVDINHNGTVIAISSIAYPNYDSPDGLVRLFKNNNEEWEQIGEDIVVQGVNNAFGYAVSLSESGNTLAIGLPSHDVPYTGCGAVNIYSITDTNEVINTGTIQGTEAHQGIGFSIDLSYDGGVLVIGSQDMEYGIVQVYEEQDGDWQLKGNQIISNVYGDKFGFNVMIDSIGNLIAAIAPSLGVLNGEMPNIKIFNYTNGEWQINNDIITSPNFDHAVQYFSLNNSGNLIAVKKRNANFGEITFHTIQNNQLEQRPDFISGEVDLNLNNEDNILSISKNGQTIAVEGSNKMKVFNYNNNEWVSENAVIESGKVIHNMKMSEDGRFVIVSFSGIDYSEKEVVVYRIGTLNSLSEQDNTELELYPNPVNSRLFLEIKIFDYKIIEIESGRVLKTGHSDNGEINVSELKTGSYILSVKKEGKPKSFKFIKQ